MQPERPRKGPFGVPGACEPRLIAREFVEGVRPVDL
jgi:hypothetical protein